MLLSVRDVWLIVSALLVHAVLTQVHICRIVLSYYHFKRLRVTDALRNPGQVTLGFTVLVFHVVLFFNQLQVNALGEIVRTSSQQLGGFKHAVLLA